MIYTHNTTAEEYEAWLLTGPSVAEMRANHYKVSAHADSTLNKLSTFINHLNIICNGK